MKYKYTTHKEETIYDGFFKFNRHYISFEKFQGGFINNVIRECGLKSDIVSVLPYDPIRKIFLFVEQFRIGMLVRSKHKNPWTLEIVSGFMESNIETPEKTAKRELIEETGCLANNLYALIEYYPSPGGSASKNHIFIASIDSSKALQYAGVVKEDEDIKVHKIPLSKIKKKMQRGEINNSTAIIALQQFFMDNWQEKL